MKKQWQKFLDDNASNWSYNIVPNLVKRLAEAKTHDEKADALKTLSAQGVVLTPDGNLAFFSRLVLQTPVRTIKEIRAEAGLTQKQLSEALHIPLRTIQSWEVGWRDPPGYLVELIEYKLFGR